MRILFGSALLASACTLAACGSHQHSAPVTYGSAQPAGSTQPANAASTGRIYNSPQEISAERQRVAQASSYRTPVTTSASNAPARLTPVTQTYNEGRSFDYNAKPIYIADRQPEYIAQPQRAPEPQRYAQVSSDLPGRVTVLPGDTVYAISRRTGASPQSIITLNHLSPPYTLTIGETLRVPSSAVPPSRADSAGIVKTSTRAQPGLRDDAVHVVQAGETLYSISRASDVSVDAIARANRLRSPYTLSIGQTLKIPGALIDGAKSAPAPKREAAASGDVADIARTVSYNKPAPTAAVAPSLFDWPVKGAVIGGYGMMSSGKRNDGVNIAAPVGTPVRAAADGEVVYRGAELDGYGNLLLIKHTDGFVTAYAHNDVMLVKKGDMVRRGQVIAKVGQTGAASEPQLHFEIRQNLKAIDPVALLGSL
ncbi:MAG: LysM peptidoglycan-binding domain-containing M23 family metallopeptidase [Parvularculaceae bacterium]|nr:LysM peptidoglycan-binding domain-containing M23 family metallopeptidase [Parvularculaceae bacterium]